MDTLHIDCTSGARKDQLVAQIYKMLPIKEQACAIQAFCSLEFEDAGFGSVDVNDNLQIVIDGHTEAEYKELLNGHHFHRSYKDVLALIDALNLSEQTAKNVKGIYSILASAEAKAHNADVDDVHFHEVGNNFAIGTIVLFCLLIDFANPAEITASTITTGFGFVKCAHGVLSIPAPATANILEGMPTCTGSIEGELCTPTGAAMVKYFAQRYC